MHSNASVQRVPRGAVIHDARGVTAAAAGTAVVLNRKDSDEVSSDHLSVNNLNHLRRGYVAPVNSGCVSEADYTMLPSARFVHHALTFNLQKGSKYIWLKEGSNFK